MKRFIALIIVISAISISAQPPSGAFKWNGSTWTAATTTATAGAVTWVPPATALYCFNAVLGPSGQWVPADSSCLGGGGGAGTVTSVTFTGDGVVDSSTPSAAVTTSGTVPATLLTQPANTSFGNFTGSIAAPTFAATTGTGSPVSATSPTLVTPALGTPSALVLTNATGTCSGCTANAVPAANLTGATLAAGVTASSLTSFGAAPALGTPASGAITNLTGTCTNCTANAATSATTATTATNLAAGTIGQIPYQSAASTTAFLAANTAATDQVLVSHGSGAAGLAPTLTNAPALAITNLTGTIGSFATSGNMTFAANGTIVSSTNLFIRGGSAGALNLGSNGTNSVCVIASAGGFSCTGSLSAASYLSATKCANGASPAVCAAAPTGSVAIPTGTNPTLVVNTTAVTAASTILLTPDDSVTIGATTCNSTLATLVGGVAITARTAATSFTISFNGVITTNPLCLSYSIIN